MATAEHHGANTRRAYRSDFAHFTRWCRAAGIPPLPATPEAVYLYLMDLVADDNSAGYAVATVERRLAAITAVHRGDGHPPTPAQHPQVRQLMAAIGRTYGRPPNARDPLTGDQLAVIVDHLNLATWSGLRDRALLLFGFASGLRRAELAALTVEQLAPDDGGYLVTPRPANPAVRVQARPGSPLCPVAAVDGWLSAAGIASGPVFRKVTRYQTVVARALAPAAVALIVKRAAQAADLPADRLAAQSLCAGRASVTPVGVGSRP
ncbi:MAG: hypothetical protein QOK39_2844 [Acidimicrobiaceae bacterium]|nr:hypothetical protein [Acidimicrobiaceae bacterium]